MNIYTLQQFKCVNCSNWFHPHTSIPFALPCSHSICSKCLSPYQKKSKSSVICCQHNAPQSIISIKVNLHIQQALERLLKNSSQPSLGEMFNEKRDRMEGLLKSKEKDLKQFIEFLENIYNNQINRIKSLKNRVMRQIFDAASSFAEWKRMLDNIKDIKEIESSTKTVEDKIRQLIDLDLEEISQTIIADTTICFQREFSINSIGKKSERKTLKSSMKPLNERNSNKSIMMSLNYPNRQNISINCVKTVDSPIKQSKNTEFCKQLSSFKLQESKSPRNQTRGGDFQKFFHRRDPSKQFTIIETNGETTLRDFEQSKCSVKSKFIQDEREKRMSDKFQDLINSLKSNNDQQLVYSPDNESTEEELLLEDDKMDVNFLKQYEFEQRKNTRDLQIKQKSVINCEKQKNKYIKRMEAVRTEQAYYNTNVSNNTIQLFNTDLKQVNLKAFLDRFDWKNIEVIKFIGTGMQDHQLNLILNYMINGKIHSLLLPNNELEEISLDALIRFTDINKYLKTVSLQKNSIHQLHTNAKAKIALLKKRGVMIYI